MTGQPLRPSVVSTNSASSPCLAGRSAVIARNSDETILPEPQAPNVAATSAAEPPGPCFQHRNNYE